MNESVSLNRQFVRYVSRNMAGMIGIPYTRIFMLFSPFFMMNYVFNAFTRNDNAPTIAMLATLLSSLCNIFMDYLLMFPLGMGMAGAGLATAIFPVIGISICCIHVLSKNSTIRIRLCFPKLKMLISGCQLGIAAFIGEMSNAITTLVFNFLLLGVAGTIAAASAKWASIASVMRGIVAIVGSALLLSAVFGITGIWLAFPAAELLTFFVTVLGLSELYRGKENRKLLDQ